MTELHQYIEDYILGRSLSDDIKKQLEDRLRSDPAFSKEVDDMRQVIESLQLSGIKSRIGRKINQPDDAQPLKTKRINLLTIGLVAILACIMLIVYVKNRDISSPAPPPKKLDQPIESRTPLRDSETPMQEDKLDVEQQDTTKTNPNKLVRPNTKTPADQSTNRHTVMAMNYFNQRLPLASGSRGDQQNDTFSADEKALSICLDLFEKNEFNVAKNCLDTHFGEREEDAEWFRAIVTLIIEGKSASLPSIQSIAKNRLHIYSRQAKDLLEALE